MRTARTAISALVAGSVLLLRADDLRVSSESVAFRLRTGDGTASVPSADLAAWPVTYRAGETVTLTSPSGAETAPVSAAEEGGETALPGAFDADGVWRLRNSNGAHAIVGVAWGTFGGPWRAAGAGVTWMAHTVGEGPDRTLKAAAAPLVAYSGDDWAGDASKAASLTFVSPDGAETAVGRTGTGAASFTFNKAGAWTVRLAMADGSTRTAVVRIAAAGFVISIR